MSLRGGGRRLALLVGVLFACAASLAPAGAAAANVVNGDFESGDLQGWQVQVATDLGNWFAYRGTDPPIGGKQLSAPIQAPPQGTFAAITDEVNPDTVILYQDVALRPGYDHRLELLAYYTSHGAIAAPLPDTLSVDSEVLEGAANQQYRIDVVRPEAPLESIDPGDVLRTLLQTKRGAPAELGPTRLTADLSPFAGQTVRLRIAVAATRETFNAGVDAVAIESAPAGQLPPPKGALGASNKFSFGKVKVNAGNGTAILPVRVPGPGKLSARAASTSKAAAHRPGRAPKPIQPVAANAIGAETVKLRLRPTAAGRAILEQEHRLRVKVAVTYRPRGGSAKTATVPVVLELRRRPAPR
jgi:hypothetical protein